jgi:cation/acetate symporter
LSTDLAAAELSGSFPVFTVFAVFVVCILLLSVGGSSGEDGLSEFYIGGRRISSAVNGFALFGGYMSAAAMLGNPGEIALTGYDGIAYTLAPAVAWVVLLLVAEPFHSTSLFTIGDSLALRLRSRPAHLAAGITTLVISLLYLIAQLVGAATLAAPILGMDGPGAQRVVVACLGLLMMLYVIIGGMRAATLVQSVKAVLLLAGGVFLALAVLSRFGWSPANLLNAAAHNSGYGDVFLRPGVRVHDRAGKLDSLSLQLAFLLGAAGLPHVLMRIGTVSTGHEARRSVQWATLLVAFFCLAAGAMGLGAAGLLGTRAISAHAASGNTAVLLLAQKLGGPVLLTLVVCLAFLTILAVVAGVTLTVASSLAHDIYGATIMRGRASEKSELLVARGAVLLTGVTAIVLSTFAQRLNISFLVGLAFAIAASAVLPALLYNLWWKGFTTRGALWSMYGGLLSAVSLVIVSPAISGDLAAMLPGWDFSFFPLRNPGLVSIPTGFLLGWLGSVLDRKEPEGADYVETEIRVLTGAEPRSS